MSEISEIELLRIRKESIAEAEDFLGIEFSGARFALITNALLSVFMRRLFEEIGVKVVFGEEVQK
jgi:pheromone shutdown protein TraB